MYGITETTVHVTYRPLTVDDANELNGSVIGVPIPDLQVYVLDAHLQPVPVGICGEMYVGGAGVARGYLQRPDLTAERFVQNPFGGGDPHDRLYKTGDLARILPSGELEYHGRIDHQVKIRGFRIELGEIESALMQHDDVREAVVIVREDTPGDKRLVGYVVLQQGQETQGLRDFLKSRLPSYMIPAVIVRLEALPLTHNGKVDLRALPKPDAATSERTYVAPRNGKEEVMAAIWGNVLQVERVGMEDPFFELGGDSILSLQVLAQARKAGLEFSLQDLFRYQTIGELSPFVREQAQEDVQWEPFALLAAEDREKLPVGVEDAYPVTHLQEGMLFHSLYSTDDAVYHNVSTYRLRAAYDRDAFAKALAHMIQRHPILRTSFDLTSYSQPLQLVHQMVSLPFQEEDLRHLTHEQQEQALTEWVEREKQAFFAWNRAPLFRMCIHRLDEETFQFGFTEHHAILDGWSVASLLTELFQVYLAHLKKEPVVAPPLRTSYREFAALEQQALQSEEHQRFWKEQLSDSTCTQLPRRETAAEHGETSAMRALDVDIPVELSQGLKRLSETAAVSLKSVLLAAHMRVMALYSGQSDVLTGLVANGRSEHEDGTQVLGLFLNTLPFRMQLAGGTWMDLVRETFHTELEYMRFRRYPMAQIQQDQGGNVLFETYFNFTHFHVYRSLVGIQDLELLDGSGYGVTNFPFGADFSQDLSTSEVKLSLSWDDKEFAEQQIEELATYYVRTLESMVQRPHEPFAEQCLLAEAQRQQLLVEWNDTQQDFPQDRCLHQVLEEQVERTPDAVALVFEEQELTYRELNERANRLAHHLQKCGVGPDVLVGVCMERSPEMVIGLLGVLKAGGAYVPLDPAYPQERLAYMLADSQAGMLLTQQRLLDVLPPYAGNIICLDADWPAIAEESVDNPAGEARADQLAYVIYTSGSTGKPKGVMIAHQSVVNLSVALQHEVYGEAQTEPGHWKRQLRVGLNSTLVFDASIHQLQTLPHGHALYILPDAVRRDAVALLNYLRRHEIDVLDCTPSQIKVLIAEGLLEQGVHVPGYILVGGEAIDETLWQRLAENESAQVFNMYGPTECTVESTFCKITQGALKPNIGRPIYNAQIYLLDAHLQPVPVGVPGELCIGGKGLARGYLNRPELTAEKFVAHPFDGTPAARIYRTGDLARYLPDGKIEYLGRIDQQVKIRGFRIELGEIEAALQQQDEVREAVVIAHTSKGGDKQLVAYWVADHEAQLTPAELRRSLQETLPDYMVPAFLVQMDALPLSPSGKVDRKALPAPEETQIARETEYVPPRDALEVELVRIWERCWSATDRDSRLVPDSGRTFAVGGSTGRANSPTVAAGSASGGTLPRWYDRTNGTNDASAAEQFSFVRLFLTGRNSTAWKTAALFLVHPVGEVATAMRSWHRQSGADNRCTGLQARGLADGEVPMERERKWPRSISRRFVPCRK